MKIKKNNELFSDINVTPFIDIMLVLLIIFIIVAKISQASFNIKLPSSSQKPDEIKDEIRISYDENNKLYLNKNLTSFDDLAKDLTQFDNKKPVFLEIYKLANYEVLIKIMDILKNNQFINVSLISQSDAN